MSRILCELLGLDQAHVSRVIRNLETVVDGSAIDVQLVGELAQQSAAMHRYHKLDPADTTSHELYHVLRRRVSDDNQRLARAIGGQHENAVSEMTPKILLAVRGHIDGRSCWAMKASVAKKLLKQHPPVAVMKALHYRSVDSLLKHEHIHELMVVVRYIETREWNELLTRSYQYLRPVDFEMRPIDVMYIDRAAYASVLELSATRHHLVLHNKEMGVVAIAPSREQVIRAYTIRTTTLLLHYICEISMMSSLLKYRHTDKNYGEQVVSALLGDETGHVTLANHRVHWRSVHSNAASASDSEKTGIGPHMENEDWLYESANDGLARLVETLVIWANYGHIAKHVTGDETVGFNVVDLALDESNDEPFVTRSLRFMRRELENELFCRYLNVPTIRRLAYHRLGIDHVL